MLEKYPITRIVHDRRKMGSRGKPATVEIEILFEKKRKWISTGVRVPSINWKDNRGVVGLPDAMDLNMKISKLDNAIKNYIRQLMIDDKPFLWSGLDQVVNRVQCKSTFVEFVEDLVNNRKDIKESTRRNHKKFLYALQEFKLINYFNDLTRGNICKYDDWLRSRKAYTQSTIASYHKYMKVYIHEAIRQEMLRFNPYDGYKVEQGKPRMRKYLTLIEVKAIENCMLPNASLERVRDLFIFQCYTGLSYADMKKFDFRNVKERNGKKVIHDVRQKTGEDFYIVLLPIALLILEKYQYVLPIITNEQYNMRLKLVAMYAKIEKPLTSHMGRHTYATLCLNSGVKIEVLAQMLGHSDIKTTQIYAKMVNTTVEEAYEKLQQVLTE